MSTPDYTTQAQALIAATEARPWTSPLSPNAPGFDFLFPDLNLTLGIPAETADEARTHVGLISTVADALARKATQ